MNLLELKKQLLDISGRTDLIDSDTLADTGIGRYIAAGIKWLDGKFYGKQGDAIFTQRIFKGSYIVRIPPCRVIQSVWTGDTEKRTKLIRRDLDTLLQEFPQPWRETNLSFPSYFSPITSRQMPDQRNIRADVALYSANQFALSSGDAVFLDRIIILPPPEVDFDIQVHGKFKSNRLIEATDSNWWTLHHMDTLVNSVMRQIEITHRNTQGVNDWDAVLISDLITLDQDYTEETFYEIDNMEG